MLERPVIARFTGKDYEAVMFEEQLEPDLTSLTFNVSIPPERANDLAEFLASMGTTFDPDSQVTVFNDDPHYQCRLTGKGVPGIIEGINIYLSNKGLRPLIPDNHHEWTLERRHALLTLAATEFCWFKENPEPPWWETEITPGRWELLSQAYAVLFEETR